MQLLSRLIETIPDGEVLAVRIGIYWTAVVVDIAGQQSCGLCATLSSRHIHGTKQIPNIPNAGQLERNSGLDLVASLIEGSETQRSVAMAALNALLPKLPQLWQETNAEKIIEKHGAGRRVAIVGHFPFVDRLRSKVGELAVLEQHPGPGDIPAEEAPRIIPIAEVVAITGMTLVNHTLSNILELCSSEAKVILMGPSTPLSPILFDFGIDILSGAVVTDIKPVLNVVVQGGNFRQVHRAGVRLVNIHGSQVSGRES